MTKENQAEPQKLLRQLRENGLHFTNPVDINMFLYYVYRGVSVSVKTK